MKVKNRKFDKKEEQGAALPGSSFCFADLLCGGNALRQPLFYGIQTEIYSPGDHIDGKPHFSQLQSRSASLVFFTFDFSLDFSMFFTFAIPFFTDLTHDLITSFLGFEKMYASGEVSLTHIIGICSFKKFH